MQIALKILQPMALFHFPAVRVAVSEYIAPLFMARYSRSHFRGRYGRLNAMAAGFGGQQEEIAQYDGFLALEGDHTGTLALEGDHSGFLSLEGTV